jgi:hypothetical protein
MKWVGTIFTFLLPMLWLAASLVRVTDPINASPTRHSSCIVSAASHCQHDASASWSWFDQAARRSNRRVNVQSGLDGPSPLADLPRSEVSNLDRFFAFAVCIQLPPELAHCWQFYCRTALEPRAPSSLVS